MKKELQDRTKNFALRIIKLSRAIPKTREGDVIARQLIRCGTSVAANYRAACRSRSKADFIAKLCIVEEEADETLFWMELMRDDGLFNEDMLSELMREANEILAIMIKSKITARNNS